jgi:tRNA pseudouridine38-40 synthase
MRIALKVEYDGSQYHGWQAQTNLRTVQFQLQEALARVANHDVEVVCAGRGVVRPLPRPSGRQG